MKNNTNVGIGQMHLCYAPSTLSVIGLGSCVAVMCFAPRLQLGGLSHIMLPASYGHCDNMPAKYADTGIDLLFNSFMRRGVSRDDLLLKIVGGADMFFTNHTSVIKVGQRNVDAVETILKHYQIRIAARDTGGTHGRSIIFDTTNGNVTVKSLQYGQTII